MPAELTAALNALARDNSCTLFMVMFAAFNVLLSRYTGQDDICVGSPIAGRRRTELEGLVGLFVRSTLAAFAHQELPFEKLVEALQPVRDQGRSPLFQTMFILQNAPWEAQPIRGIEVRPGDAGPVETAKYELTVSVHEYEGELWVNFEYNRDLFDAETIDRLAGSYETLLREIAKHPEESIQELALLSVEQHREFGGTTKRNVRVFDESLMVHELIAEQVQRTPDAIALESKMDILQARCARGLSGRVSRRIVAARSESIRCDLYRTCAGHDDLGARCPAVRRRLRAAGPNLPGRAH